MGMHTNEVVALVSASWDRVGAKKRLSRSHMPSSNAQWLGQGSNHTSSLPRSLSGRVGRTDTDILVESSDNIDRL